MGKSSIEWTTETWNPVTGCIEVGPGCAGCYARRHAERFRGTPGHPYENGFDITLRPGRLPVPFERKAPTTFFVNSMSDLFLKEIPPDYLDAIFDRMESTPRHTFQVLTKRSSLMRNYVNARYAGRQPPGHIWLGVSVEIRQVLARVDHLRDTSAAVRFLSVEPLLEDVGTLDLKGIHWVIVGGESGPKARQMLPEWARGVRDQCLAARVPFFFKQWGQWSAEGVRRRSSRENGRLLDGVEWSEMPLRQTS